MLVISEAEIKKAITMDEVMKAVEVALVEYSERRTVTPVRTAISTSQTEGTALFMPSLVESAAGLGMKFVSVFPKNKDKTIYGVMILSDVESGEPLALMESSSLTVLRTGAASGLATKYLAKEDAKVLGVIGTGSQSRGLIEAILHVRPSVSEIRLFNRTKKKASVLAEELMSRYQGIEIVIADTADQAVRGADIIVTATTSEKPVFSAESVMEGAHINGVGSFKPSMQEIPTEVITDAAKVVVESKEAALEECGDLINPIQAGLFQEDALYGELGEIINGMKAGREADGEITVFKSVGLAAMDVVVAKAIYDKALELGIGQRVQL
ncbi:NAD(P)-binding domain-containing protein [Bacillus xiapuensis]|uniref:NAD(P)-binding domain-containing protein n=1 Tax=Bacillus xiapuensis TaxID=2014075 RepID=A0ABU6NBP3_9BACI|nr:NAD(P)-binding domain-containing protein [Bacillus xiapuensis]